MKATMVTGLLFAALLALAGPASAGRALSQIVETHKVQDNPEYKPTAASTIDGSGGQVAALSIPHSSGIFVQPAHITSAGPLIPGPTAASSVTAPLVGGAVASGLARLPIIGTGDVAAASSTGNGGNIATSYAAPDSLYVGAATRVNARGDITGIYGGNTATANSDVGGNVFGGATGYGQPTSDNNGILGHTAATNTLVNGARPSHSHDGGFWEAGMGGRSSYSGAQTFDNVAYGAAGIGGPVATAAAGQALAVSATGSAPVVQQENIVTRRMALRRRMLA